MLYVFSHYVFHYDIYNKDLLIWGVTGVTANLVCFMIMLNFKLDSLISTRILYICFILMSLTIISYSGSGQFRLNEGNDIEGLASYQAFARSLLIIAYICFVYQKKAMLRNLIALLTLIALFVNGARSELFFFICSIFLFTLFTYKRNYTLILSALILTIILLFKLDYFVQSFESNRTFDLLNLSNSTSYQGRKELGANAWQVIQDQPLLGQYGYYVDEFGIGGYAHNILSAWADFGILGFLLFLGVSIYILLYSMYKIIIKNSNNKIIHLLFLYSFSLFFAYLTAKDYSYMLFGLSLGLYVNYQKLLKEKAKF